MIVTATLHSQVCITTCACHFQLRLMIIFVSTILSQFQISSRASMDGPYYSPPLDKDDLQRTLKELSVEVIPMKDIK